MGSEALAAERYVDGGCAVDGDGTVVTCASVSGATGPFKRIAAGVKALRSGDTLHVRGRHDGFDGVYRGEYLGIFGADHLDCRASRCTIRGYQGERPVVSGFKTYGDWQQTSPGSAVWFRDMERHDECQGQGPSGGAAGRRDPDADWDPQLIVQDRTGIRIPLQYNDRIGGARFVEERLKDDGSWWHDLAGHRSYVNPHGGNNPNRDPGTVLLVPQEQALIVIDGSGECGQGPPRVSHNVLVKQIAMEGARSKFVEVNGRVGESASDIRFEAISMRFTGGRYAFHTQRVTRFSVEDAVSEWIGRGLSWHDHVHAFRTFHMDHATLRGITCRHLGSDNTGRRAFLDPPWANVLSSWWGGGTCLQVKQSNDVMLHDITAEDLSLVGVALDVSRRTVLDGFDIRRAASAIALMEFTPAPRPCDERNDAHFCHNYDHVIRNGRIHASGMDPIGAIVVDRNARDAHKKLQAGQFTAKIYNVAITYPRGAAIRVRDVDGVSVWNVSVYGDMSTLFPSLGRPQRPAKGIVVAGDVRSFEARNNIFAGRGNVAIEVMSNATGGAAGLTFDHDLFDGSRGFRGAGQELHGRAGSARFLAVPGSLLKPPDLHAAPNSSARGMGANLSAHFQTDADGKPRKTWDAGAYRVE
jgi:hypothetical protein